MRRDQKGMASIVVVSILIVIMTLISIGFARLMSRTVTTSANRAFSSAATYAAESGINDVSSYLKQYVQAHPGNLQPVSTQCTGSNSLIGSTGNPGPFYNDSNLAGNTDRSTQYTCILLNPTPGDLDYQQITAGKSQVVKLNTSAVTGALDKLMISWQADDTALTGFPPNVGQLTDETTWNDSSHHYIPLLRVTIYPVPVSNNLTNVQSDSRTVFLYPQQSSGNVPVQSYGSLKDGSIVPVGCTSTVGSGTFTGSADDKCNIIISDLAKALGDGSTADTQLNYAYLRLTPIYNQLDVKLKANDIAGQALSFVNDQAVVDVTAQTAGVAKRLQARVDTSSLGSSQGEDDNLSFNSNSFPEDSVRSANALCKRLVQTTSYFNYVSFDDPDNVCHDTNGNNNINSPQPTLTLSITGHTGPDDGKTVDSQANNPDSPQNPVQQGTVYINSGGSATLNWTSHDATHCIAGGGWSGDQAPSMSWSGTTGTGTQTFTGITSKTDYTLQCNRTGTDNRPSTTVSTPNLKVTAWPPPVVSLTADSTVHAGDSMTLTWTVDNSYSCVASGDWSGSKDPSTGSHSEGVGTEWWDQGTHTYTITCTDPIGRTATSTVQRSLNGGGGGGGGGNHSVQTLSPTCHASVSPFDNGNGTGGFSWNGTCPDVSPGSGYYQLYNCSGVNCAAIGKSGWVGSASSINGMGPGHYCVDFRSGADPWGWIADSGQVCWDIVPPPITAYGYWSYEESNDVTHVNCGGGHSDCAGVYWGGHDPIGQAISCNLYVNGAYEGNAYSNYGSAASYIVVGWNTYAQMKSASGSVTCTGTYGRTTNPPATFHF